MSPNSAILLLLAAILLAFLASPSSAYFIRMNDGDSKCFLEEYPSDTLMMVKWKGKLEQGAVGGGARTYSGQSRGGISIVVTVIDPESNTVLTKTAGLEGRIALNAPIQGEYTVCFQPTSGSWFGRSSSQLKLEIAIESGVDAIDYDEVAQAEELNEIEKDVRRLNDRAFQILKEQNYLKVGAEEYP
eukprot:TRINITY_DN3615_c0_g1_i1.p1 TRINITY_DN3615_c0_g1~~TRINITY_DN3615_c0_g1_i1.p1  ORF type:complete len:187 (+),score=78.80 TRINITY_DN3615_c0_g1_i1:32-592(+)